MKQFLSVLRVSLNVNFHWSYMKFKFLKQKKQLWQIPLFLIGLPLIAVPFMYVMYVYVKLIDAMLVTGRRLAQPEFVLAMGIVYSQLVALIFGFFYLISTLYFSDDINLLLTLPLSPAAVLGARFVTVLINEYLTMAVIAVPPFVVYGLHQPIPAVYWPLAAVVYLLLPLIPLTADTLFVTVLMRVTGLSRSKHFLRVAGALAVTGFALGFQILFSRLPQGSEEEFLQKLIARPGGLVDIIGRRFPPSIWATKLLAAPALPGSIIYLLLFLSLNLICVTAVYLLARHIYYPGLMETSQVQRGHRQLLSSAVPPMLARTRSPLLALIDRELKTFLRHPIFLMTGAMNILLVPIVLLISAVATGHLKSLISLFNQPQLTPYVTLGLGGILTFLTATNTIAATSVSREGRLFWISRLIPVHPRLQVLAKLIHALIYAVFNVIIIDLIVLYLAPVGISVIIIGSITGFLGSLLAVVIGVLIDVCFPKLRWSDPQQAMKGNINALIAMVVPGMLMAATGYMDVRLLMYGLKPLIVYAVTWAILILLVTATLSYTLHIAEERYRRIV